MNKINNTTTYRTISGLGILAILVFGIATIPTKANAQQYGRGPNGTGTGALGGYVFTISENSDSDYYQISTYVPAPAPTPTVYSYSTNPNAVKTAPKTIVVTKAETEASPIVNTAPVNTPVAVAKTTFDNSNLASTAIFGSNSFKPSGLIQWIFFAIIVLLIVILVRKIFGGKEKYLAIPMKHD